MCKSVIKSRASCYALYFISHASFHEVLLHKQDLQLAFEICFHSSKMRPTIVRRPHCVSQEQLQEDFSES